MPNRVLSFAAIALTTASVGCGGPSYDLRDEVGPTDVHRSVGSFSFRSDQFSIEAGGRSVVVEGQTEMQINSVTETDVLKVEDGRPVRLKVSCFVDEMRWTMNFSDAPVEKTTESGPLAGRSVLFDRDGDR